MTNNAIEKDLKDRFSKVASTMLQEDLDPSSMVNFANEMDSIQAKTKLLNLRQLSDQSMKDLELVNLTEFQKNRLVHHPNQRDQRKPKRKNREIHSLD